MEKAVFRILSLCVCVCVLVFPKSSHVSMETSCESFLTFLHRILRDEKSGKANAVCLIFWSHLPVVSFHENCMITIMDSQHCLYMIRIRNLSVEAMRTCFGEKSYITVSTGCICCFAIVKNIFRVFALERRYIINLWISQHLHHREKKNENRKIAS